MVILANVSLSVSNGVYSSQVSQVQFYDQMLQEKYEKKMLAKAKLAVLYLWQKIQLASQQNKQLKNRTLVFYFDDKKSMALEPIIQERLNFNRLLFLFKQKRLLENQLEDPYLLAYGQDIYSLILTYDQLIKLLKKYYWLILLGLLFLFRIRIYQLLFRIFNKISDPKLLIKYRKLLNQLQILRFRIRRLIVRINDSALGPYLLGLIFFSIGFVTGLSSDIIAEWVMQFDNFK